ncbi:MAG TPA: hypothetical protein VF814_05865 [Casimicrobiaceae bacterium]
MNDLAGPDGMTDRELVQATLRVNTIIFSLILGLFAGIALLALALLGAGHGGLVAALIGVFLPGYGPGWPGALLGFAWGVVIGGLLGGGIYRLNVRHVLEKIDELTLAQRNGEDFPRAILRLDGHALGLALGAALAAGLLTTTNVLVLRGTAGESVHAWLLAEILPGYTVTTSGSIVGALELFALAYIASRAFVTIYNRLALRRRR